MNISPKSVRFDENSVWVELSDGRSISAPLAWFPRLLKASSKQRLEFELSLNGIHWEALDEDISISGLLAGKGDQTKSQTIAA
jgi:hypothetical protein